MDAGLLRHRITMQEHKEIGRDQYNNPKSEWVDICRVWASIEPISGREYWASAQTQSEVTHRIRIRYRRGIKPTMRIIYQGRIFEIETIIDYQERHEYLQLMCKEVVR